MKQLTTLCLVLAAACGSVTTPDSASGDDAMDPGPDAGMTGPPIDPAVLSMVPRAVLDERGDTIAFATGEPVHTHTGPTVMLGSAGCPDLSRYAYLLDRHPAYGKDAAPNPLAVTVALPDRLVADSAQYRINVGNDSFSAWTALPGGAGDRATIALHRDDIPALGTFDGEIKVEVKATVTGGIEQTASACWKHHPLAAPLSVEAPVRATGSLAIDTRMLAVNSTAIDIVSNGGLRDAEVFTVRVVQQTAEPIQFELKPTAPAGSYTTTVVDAYAASQTSTLGKNCDTDEAYCDVSALPDPPDVTRAGTLATGAWVVRVVDEANGFWDCPNAFCTIPARPVGGPARVYRITLSLKGVGDLWPVPTTVTELGIAGHSIVGGWLSANKATRCQMFKTLNGVTACIKWTEYTELHALDRARLDLGATTLRISTGRGGSTAVSPAPYLAGGAVIAPATSWDGGDGPM